MLCFVYCLCDTKTRKAPKGEPLLKGLKLKNKSCLSTKGLITKGKVHCGTTHKVVVARTHDYMANKTSFCSFEVGSFWIPLLLLGKKTIKLSDQDLFLSWSSESSRLETRYRNGNPSPPT